jgi:hypothetical protein
VAPFFISLAQAEPIYFSIQTGQVDLATGLHQDNGFGRENNEVIALPNVIELPVAEAENDIENFWYPVIDVRADIYYRWFGKQRCSKKHRRNQTQFHKTRDRKPNKPNRYCGQNRTSARQNDWLSREDDMDNWW